MQHQKPGTRFMTTEGNMCVNFHNMFFFMTRLGKYVPWKLTLHHGALLPHKEWVRIRDLSGGTESVKPLTDFLNKKASIIAEQLRTNRFFGLTEDQKSEAELNRYNFVMAQKENITVEEYLKRKAVRDERAAARASKPVVVPAKPMPVKTKNGEMTYFSLEYLPAMQQLKQKFA